MTREELLEAIGRVDDDLIQEAEDCRLPARRPGLTHWRPLAGGLAACLVLAAVFYLPFGMSGGGDNTTSGAAGSSSAAQESQTDHSAGTAQDGGSDVWSGSGEALPENPSAGNESSGGSSSQEGGAVQDVLRTPRGSIPSPASWPPHCRRAAASWACSFWRGRTARRGCTPPAGSTPAACCGRGRTEPSM